MYIKLKISLLLYETLSTVYDLFSVKYVYNVDSNKYMRYLHMNTMNTFLYAIYIII